MPANEPSKNESPKDIGVELADFVATVEIRRPPHNFFDYALIQQIADAFESLDQDPACRAIVLAAQGKSFCAGANFGDGSGLTEDGQVKNAPGANRIGHLYVEAVRLFRTRKPIVGGIHGPAVGGGLGLALVPDFRVTCAEARFSANFTRLGFHPGFGLTVTLPELIGRNKAALMFYTGRRIKGDEALAMGLADLLVPQAEVRAAAQALAREIATSAPLAVVATRATLRQGLADRVRAATDHELEVQTKLRQTRDFKEGVKASAERRTPAFVGS
jgi:enoyl-CoA hydratase/carnithine racemase